ncbi:hypothetical protein [Roseibium sediminicola]|uniref:Uncharacterized protein n=1 Tax=Roseibium sediminicola TaxID=2933272 RepID=A0ABT0GZX8_9HYPH|nr:hypothetical protein [Roseibium sp. CAU 1639]MCK7614395.1 hypothetical protein [Roseibium sp. CAU 1639]
MPNFLVRREKEILTCSAIFGAAGVAIGFIVTIIQLGNSSEQIARAQRTLENGNAYMIQTDARKIVSSVFNDPALQKLLFAPTPGDASETDMRQALVSVGMIFSFYSDVFELGKRSALPAGVYDEFGQDFCGILGTKSGIIKSYWEAALKNPVTATKFTEMKNGWCP